MRILVVEDEPTLRRQLRAAGEAAGYVVDECDNGRDAHFLGDTETYDAVVLDLGLPLLDGLTVLRRWREAGRAVPVLILTARDNWTEKVAGIDAGADDYMTKPFGVKEIIARIRAILRRTATRVSTSVTTKGDEVFTMDDLRIVPDELRAYRGELEIQLSPRDVKVLRLLFDRRGKVVDRNTLADEVWGVDYFPESRALDQHISQLRKRVEKDPSQPRVIRTVHGAGYRYE